MAAPHQQPAPLVGYPPESMAFYSVEAACSGSNLYRSYYPLFLTAAGLGSKISERMSTK
jgi:hypothetical protein